MLWVTSTAAQHADSSTLSPLRLRIPIDRDWIFDHQHPARFSVEVLSAEAALSDDLRFEVTTEFGQPVSTQAAPVRFAADSTATDGGFRSRATFTLGQLTPGFYRARAIVGRDTLQSFSFGYEPDRLVSNPDGPADLKKFWTQTLAELKAVEPHFRMTRMPDHSIPERSVYQIEMQSLGGDTLRGYWAAPTDGKRHPAIVIYQGYDAKTWIPEPGHYPGWCVLVWTS